MLQIRGISKEYKTGDLIQRALNNVSLNLRDNEFVSILGPSGSGKTTLLNIIGGLDRYDSGDLIVNGISTKKYRDRDWDSYRNHTIGFVFQSYNLIPHQSVLANVELALTISGLSRKERRKRARKALEEVGLGNQLHKRPNQMSGGQMQRVAIARALVNDPDILLADEPTGALDSETSLQVMELLKRVAEKRLVVMVTHNPELAEKYSTRIVRLRDGQIISDSNPFAAQPAALPVQHKNMGRAKMSFFTSLALSFNNLRTKKGRTLLTSFAGSIGIIGIALILALSTGVNQYIADIQKDTMSSYPITINAKAIDLSGFMEMSSSMASDMKPDEEAEASEGIHAGYLELEAKETLNSSITENDLTSFKKYLENPQSEIKQYLGENGAVYTYNVNFRVYSYDPDGNITDSNADASELIKTSDSDQLSAMMKQGKNNRKMAMSSVFGKAGSTGADNFQELMAGADQAAVSPVITESYDLLYGSWPQNYDEVVLVLNHRNEISAEALYQLGLITADQYKTAAEQIQKGEEAPEINWDYPQACEHSFYLVPACDHYIKNGDGSFSYIGGDSAQYGRLAENGLKLRIAGVIRPKKDAANALLTSPVAYTSKLTDYVIAQTDASDVITAQEASPDINVLTNMKFEAADDQSKISDAKEYLSAMNISDKAAFYTMMLYYSSESTAEPADPANPATPVNPSDPTIPAMPSDPSAMTENPLMSKNPEFNSNAGEYGINGEAAMAAALDNWLLYTPDDDLLISVYDQYIAGETYGDNMTAFGKVSYDAPDSISLYTDSFENKDLIAGCIEKYNKTADDASKITYTDYVALLTSSITSIVDVVSYVLIAFVAVSLIVSCIMIGIITHISVLERTKEIGILRALGASKRNISQVFNAETFIIGFCAGLLGVGVSMLLTIPINSVIAALLEDSMLKAQLSPLSAVILILISMLITVTGGLIPAKKAAKKDPVIALRTE